MARSKQVARVSAPTITSKSGNKRRKPNARSSASSASGHDSRALPLGVPKSSAPHHRFRVPDRCTMGYLHYDERHGECIVGRAVPRLRLSGRWLEQCGFAVGDALRVTVGRGVLLISRRQDKG